MHNFLPTISKRCYMNNNVIDDFKVRSNEFTIFVIGQTYYHIRGNEFLKQYRNTENWIASDKILEKRIKRLLSWIQKNTPNVAELIENVIAATNSPSKKMGLIDIIIALSKIFGVTEQVAVGPEVIDPVIIEEEKVTKRNLTHYVTMHEKCKYRPAIIVLLKDDDYDRAETLLANCPNGMNVKMIKNDGTSKHYKVINEGAKNVEDFLDAYSRQCFSTCSRTDHGVLMSGGWSNNKTISEFSPTIFQIRSIFIKEHKLDAATNIIRLQNQLNQYEPTDSSDMILKQSFTCMNDLFKVYCYDRGGYELNEAYELADSLDNDILRAHVYRYSHFLDCSRAEKQELLLKAENIFAQYGIADHAIYCCNNRLIHQFSMDSISVNDFSDLEGRATYDTPGLALMAHIINNVGVAYLFEHFLDSAIEEFNRGLSDAKYNHIQSLALKSNMMIAKTLSYYPFEEKEARNILAEIFTTPSLGLHKMPFLTAQFALNVIACALMSNPVVANQLLHEFKILELVQSAFNQNSMGTGSMVKQMEILSFTYHDFDLLNKLNLPKQRTSVSGIRLNFICQYGLNPFFFNTWL